MKNSLFLAALALGVCVAVFGGCNKGPKKVQISGTVTVAGEPVDKGSIQLTSVEDGSQSGGAIQDGKFDCEVTTGEKKVVVNGSKVVGQWVPDPQLNPDKTADKLEDYPGFPFREEKNITVTKKGETFELKYGEAAE